MRKSDFYYELPPQLIAQHPPAERTGARLLCLEGTSGAISDRYFAEIGEVLSAGDLLVFNDTRVIPARLYGTKDTGGRIEVLVERVHDATRVSARIRASKPPKAGQALKLEHGLRAQVIAREGEFYELAFDGPDTATALLERYGHIPLPPYIERTDETADHERYQTVYARVPGAVAAPTAGLHFDKALLDKLAAAKVEMAFVTLHVGAGTFQPLRSDNIEGERLHAERVEVPAVTCAQINRARAEGRRVIAVGTTTVRALESVARAGRAEPLMGETDIFIYPGYRFQLVDALITNFHLPESSLLMLVCAFAGTEKVLAAYRYAVQEQYRFYSYGDAMFVTRG